MRAQLLRRTVLWPRAKRLIADSRGIIVFGWVLLALTISASRVVQAQNTFSGQVIAVEAGDRLRVRLDAWTVTVQLHGIVCPLASPEFVTKARAYTTRRVGGVRVRVAVRGTGAKQMVYGEVTPADGGSLNEELVRVGLAIWARQYAPQRTELGALENAARTARRGVWGNATGANVALPPIAAALVPRAAPTPRPTPTATPTPIPTPTAQAASPTPAPAPSTPPLNRVAVAEAPTEDARTPHVGDAALGVWAFATGTLLALLVRRQGFERRRFAFQCLLALAGGSFFALLAPLPLLLSQSMVRSAQVGSAFLAGGTTALAVGLLFMARRLGRRDRILRGTPRVAIGDAGTNVSGCTHLRGETSAPNGVVHSSVGGIYGIYVREIIRRYEPGQARTGNRKPENWITLRDETQTVDFHLTDETGTLAVDAGRAAFHPLRVARFYNDIPVETFFDRPYGGDTRIEVFFIPQSAEVSVWGRRYKTATPNPAQAEERVGYDAAGVGLVVVEGREGRVFARRPVALLLASASVACLLLAVGTALLNPLGLVIVLFVCGLMFPIGFVRAWRTARAQRAARDRAWEDTEAVLNRRKERLPELARLVFAVLPEHVSLLQELKNASDAVSETVNRVERLETELQLSRVLARLSATVETFLPAANGQAASAAWSGELATEINEVNERERYLAEARERYNEAADTVNRRRRAFPHGLVLRAWEAEPTPLFGGVETT